MTSRRITVSIVSHGQTGLLDRLLGDLLGLHGAAIERIVVTLNLGEAWQGPANAQPPITVMRNARPLGFAENHNAAFSLCDTPLFAVLNPDLRIASDPFTPLSSAFDGDAACGLAAPLQRDEAGAIEDFRRRLPTPWALTRRAWARLTGARRPLTSTPRAEWLAGAFMLFDSNAFRQLGGFDTRYRLYCEDVDICLRLQLGGWRLAVDEQTQVVHAAQRGSGRHLRYLIWHLQSLLRLWTSAPYWRWLLLRRRSVT